MYTLDFSKLSDSLKTKRQFTETDSEFFGVEVKSDEEYEHLKLFHRLMTAKTESDVESISVDEILECFDYVSRFGDYYSSESRCDKLSSTIHRIQVIKPVKRNRRIL